MRIRIGPLKYLFAPHDDRAEAMLSSFARNMDCVPFGGDPDRIIHLLESPPEIQEKNETSSSYLPDCLAACLPETPYRSGWKRLRDCTAILSWLHPHTEHTFWTLDPHSFGGKPFFFIPWQIIFQDIVRLGGGIMHTGMAGNGGKGLLFSAPSGGGKSTTISRVPPPWTPLADDVVLLWSSSGAYFASPLPTLSVLLPPVVKQPFIKRWRVGTTCAIVGLMFLVKANHEALSPCQPVAAVPKIFRALQEHVAADRNGSLSGKGMFHLACDAVRSIPSWNLELSLEGCLGTLFEESEFHG